MADCGVFGVSSQEYLGYAEQNRKEWESRGQDIVAEMLVTAKRKNVSDVLYNIQQDNVDVAGREAVKEILASQNQRRASVKQSQNGGGGGGVPLEVSTSGGDEANTGQNGEDAGDLKLDDGDFVIPLKDD